MLSNDMRVAFILKKLFPPRAIYFFFFEVLLNVIETNEKYEFYRIFVYI